MAKLRILKVINFIILSILFCVLALLYFNKRTIFNGYWYVVVILFYSIMLFCKYLIFGSDSVLWFSICLALFGAYMICFNRGVVGIDSFPILIVIPSIASLGVFAIYKNILHLNLFVMCLFIAMPMFLISLKIVVFWLFLIIEVVSILLGAVIIKYIYHNYKR